MKQFNPFSTARGASLTLRLRTRLSVFENRVLRKILGCKRKEVTGDWKKLHNEEIHDFYSPPLIITAIKQMQI